MIQLLSKKEFLVLKILQENVSRFISSQEISQQVGFSDRTARKYLNLLEDNLIDQGAELVRKQGHGFKLVINNPLVFNIFWQNELNGRFHPREISDLEEMEDRQHFILSHLFFEDDKISSEQIEDSLFLSKVIVSELLREIRKLLALYDLTLESDKEGTLTVNGKEQAKRKFIINYFFSSKFNQDMLPFIGETFFNSEIHLNELTIIVLDETRDLELNISDYIVHNLVIHIALTMVRLKKGNHISSLNLDFDILRTNEYRVATNIIKRIEMNCGIHFPKQEIIYIALHLISKGSKGSSIDNEDQDLEIQLVQALDHLSKKLNGHISCDSILLNGLEVHLAQLMIRLRNRVPISNPILEDILKNYPEEFNITKEIFGRMSLLLDYNLSDEEWAYIVLHVLAAIERFYNRQKVKVLVVCATGLGSAQLLRNRLENELGNAIQIKDVVSYYDLSDRNIEDIDLIISSINLNHILLPIPVLQVDVLVNEVDIDNIKKFIHKDNLYNIKIEKNSLNHQLRVEEKFERLFKEENFIYIEEKIAKTELLLLMISKLKDKVSNENFLGNFCKELELRESFGSVAFDQVLALPHPTRPMTYSEQVVVAIIPKGIYWDENHKEIRFIFLISPAKESNKHIQDLSSVFVDFLEEKEIQKELLVCKQWDCFKSSFIKLLK